MAKRKVKKPNWKNPKDYPDPDTPSGEEWALEFLRRNPEYRSEYKRLMNEYWKPPYGEMPVSPPPRAGEILSEYYKRMEAMGIGEDRIKRLHEVLAEKFGIMTMIDPNTPGSFDVDFLSTPTITMPFFGDTPLRAGTAAEFVVKFDLSKPLPPQLKIAERQLKKRQEKYKAHTGYKIKTRKFQKALFPVYLRILDADEAGASAKEIGEVLFPNEKNEAPDYLRSKKVSETLEAAIRIRDFDYRVIPQNFPV